MNLSKIQLLPTALKIKKENVNPPKSREEPCPYTGVQSRRWQEAAEQEYHMGRSKMRAGNVRRDYSVLAAGSCSVKYYSQVALDNDLNFQGECRQEGEGKVAQASFPHWKQARAQATLALCRLSFLFLNTMQMTSSCSCSSCSSFARGCQMHFPAMNKSKISRFGLRHPQHRPQLF